MPVSVDPQTPVSGGSMFIAAHQDDNLLFMNPTLQSRMDSGVPVVAIDLTAGDAGENADYWTGREAGKKAAFALMAGTDDWVDEVVTLDIEGQSFSVASSYLASRPEIRLYFLRLPDGFSTGTGTDTYGFESLQLLWDGAIESVTAVDGSASYSADQLVSLLGALMTLHEPEQVHLQDHDSELAGIEHSDHIHTALFAIAALPGYLADVTVTSYVGYASWGLEENLTPEQYAEVLAAFEAYAGYDPHVLGEDGSILEPYLEWVQREYVANEYFVADPMTGITLAGTAGKDTLLGGDLNDTLIGEGRRDELHGNEGNDVLSGGRGRDLLFGGAGNDLLDGGNSNDRLVAGGGNDTVIGGKGSDRAFLGKGDDIWYDDTQASGDDYVVAGDGDDTLYVGAGDDTMSGRDGADCFVFADRIGHDIITDYTPGMDALQFAPELWNGPLDLTHLQALASQVGLDVVIAFDSDNSLTLRDVTLMDSLLEDISLG